MMKLPIFIFIFLLSINFCYGQRSLADSIHTSKGQLIIQPIFHGTIVFTWNSKTIYVDPYGGANSFTGVAPADIVLITDIHGDHLNLETLSALQVSNAVFVVPKAVADRLPEHFKRNLIILNNGEMAAPIGIQVLAMPMYNLPETEDSRHPKGRGNGYILTLGDKRIYVCGDTEDIPEMRSLKNIDVAFICMNAPTMDVNLAASATLEFKPKIVYPFHHKGSDIELFKNLVNEANPTIDVRIRNWYPQ